MSRILTFTFYFTYITTKQNNEKNQYIYNLHSTLLILQQLVTLLCTTMVNNLHSTLLILQPKAFSITSMSYSFTFYFTYITTCYMVLSRIALIDLHSTLLILQPEPLIQN